MEDNKDNKNPFDKIEEGEPFFIIHSSYIHAPFAVTQLAESIKEMDPNESSKCLKFAALMANWQQKNPDKVRRPD